MIRLVAFSPDRVFAAYEVDDLSVRTLRRVAGDAREELRVRSGEAVELYVDACRRWTEEMGDMAGLDALGEYVETLYTEQSHVSREG